MRDSKSDRSQAVVIAALRTLGFFVQDTHTLGQGVPDFVVADEWSMIWVEWKTGGLPTPALPDDAREMFLTPDEKRWHKNWPARTALITNRLSEILERFGWPPDDINAALDKVQDDPGVKQALAAARRKYGPDPDIAASLA